MIALSRRAWSVRLGPQPLSIRLTIDSAKLQSIGYIFITPAYLELGFQSVLRIYHALHLLDLQTLWSIFFLVQCLVFVLVLHVPADKECQGEDNDKL